MNNINEWSENKVKFEREYIVGVKDIGLNNVMNNYAFLSFFEEIASTHSQTVGLGVNDIESKKKVWILMDWKLKVFNRPKYGDKLKIKTWARPIKNRFFYTYRDFEMFLGEKRIAIATSKWVLFDLNTNKICKLNEEIMQEYNPDNDRVFEEDEIPKIKETMEKEFAVKYEVRRSDIDVNNHMHNLNYLTLAYEVLPEEEYLKDEKMNVSIMYKHQILLKDKVKCYYSKHEEKNVITIKSEDDSKLHSIIELY